MLTKKTKLHNPAGFYNRFLAALFDLSIWLVIWFICHHILVNSPQVNVFLIRISDKIILPVILAYYIIMEWLNGATLGKMLMKIKIYSKGKNKITLYQSFIRNGTKPISLIVFFIGYLVILFRNDKRALHDILANCQVMKLK